MGRALACTYLVLAVIGVFIEAPAGYAIVFALCSCSCAILAVADEAGRR